MQLEKKTIINLRKLCKIFIKKKLFSLNIHDLILKNYILASYKIIKKMVANITVESYNFI
jgi:hypothetical protein